MIMPLVLLIGWLMNEIIGDQGGSNPLLELVLSSDEFIPLFLLLITTVVLAPVFEELVFRGVLLPVLVSKVGKISGVLLSALIFALAHLSVGELPPIICFRNWSWFNEIEFRKVISLCSYAFSLEWSDFY